MTGVGARRCFRSWRLQEEKFAPYNNWWDIYCQVWGKLDTWESVIAINSSLRVCSREAIWPKKTKREPWNRKWESGQSVKDGKGSITQLPFSSWGDQVLRPLNILKLKYWQAKDRKLSWYRIFFLKDWMIALLDILIWNCRYIETFEKYRYQYWFRTILKISIAI